MPLRVLLKLSPLPRITFFFYSEDTFFLNHLYESFPNYPITGPPLHLIKFYYNAMPPDSPRLGLSPGHGAITIT